MVQRARRQLTVRFSTRAGDWSSGFTADIGPGGMKVCAPQRLFRAGCPIVLQIELPGRGAVDATGTIAWATSPQQRDPLVAFGCRLTNAPEAWFRYCLDELG